MRVGICEAGTAEVKTMTTKPSTTTQETRELEPCPLCGSTDLLLRDIAGWELDCRGCELSLVLADDPSREGLIRRWNTRAPSTTEQVPRLREALEPHKAISFLTALEHQARRNHEYHPDQCAECSLTQTIAERLREELRLTSAALQPKAETEGEQGK